MGISSDPGQPGSSGILSNGRFAEWLGRLTSQRDRGLGSLGHGAQAGKGPLETRRVGGVGRDSDDPGVEAAKEGGNIFQPRWVEQQSPFTGGGELLEGGGN